MQVTKSLNTSGGRPARWRPIVLLVAFFVLSRAIIYPLRPFWYEPINHFMQYLDPVVLREGLLDGLSHLHTQPPLFNLFLGVVLKLAPRGGEPLVFASLYAVSGLALMLSVYGLMRGLGVRVRLGMAVCMALMLSPSVIQAERWLFYSYPVTLLLAASGLFLYRFVRSGRLVDLLTTLSAFTAIVLTRSFFHPLLWMAPALALLVILTRLHQPRHASVCLLLSLLSLTIAGSAHLKNYARHGIFTASTWQGMSLGKMTRYVNRDDLEPLIEDSVVSPLVRTPTFSRPEAYLAYYGTEEATGVDVLDRVVKTTGAPNWNHIVYVRASKEYARNSLRLIARFPGAYLKAVLNEIYLFFGLRPHLYFDEFGLWGRAGGVGVPAAIRRGLVLYVAPAICGMLFLLAVIGFRSRLLRALRTPAADRDTAVLSVCPYALFVLGYVFGLANLAELGEGCYMRMPTDPLTAVGCALFLEDWIGRTIGRGRLQDN